MSTEIGKQIEELLADDKVSEPIIKEQVIEHINNLLAYKNYDLQTFVLLGGIVRRADLEFILRYLQQEDVKK